MKSQLPTKVVKTDYGRTHNKLISLLDFINLDMLATIFELFLFFQTKLFQIYTTNNDTKIIQLSLLLVPYCIHLHWCRVWNLCLDSYLVLHFDLQGVLFFDSGTNEVANVTKLPPLILKKCMQICSLVSQHAVTQVARY